MRGLGEGASSISITHTQEPARSMCNSIACKSTNYVEVEYSCLRPQRDVASQLYTRFKNQI